MNNNFILSNQLENDVTDSNTDILHSLYHDLQNITMHDVFRSGVIESYDSNNEPIYTMETFTKVFKEVNESYHKIGISVLQNSLMGLAQRLYTMYYDLVQSSRKWFHAQQQRYPSSISLLIYQLYAYQKCDKIFTLLELIILVIATFPFTLEACNKIIIHDLVTLGRRNQQWNHYNKQLFIDSMAKLLHPPSHTLLLQYFQQYVEGLKYHFIGVDMSTVMSFSTTKSMLIQELLEYYKAYSDIVPCVYVEMNSNNGIDMEKGIQWLQEIVYGNIIMYCEECEGNFTLQTTFELLLQCIYLHTNNTTSSSITQNDITTTVQIANRILAINTSRYLRIKPVLHSTNWKNVVVHHVRSRLINMMERVAYATLQYSEAACWTPQTTDIEAVYGHYCFRLSTLIYNMTNIVVAHIVDIIASSNPSHVWSIVLDWHHITNPHFIHPTTTLWGYLWWLCDLLASSSLFVIIGWKVVLLNATKLGVDYIKLLSAVCNIGFKYLANKLNLTISFPWNTTMNELPECVTKNQFLYCLQVISLLVYIGGIDNTKSPYPISGLFDWVNDNSRILAVNTSFHSLRPIQHDWKHTNVQDRILYIQQRLVYCESYARLLHMFQNHRARKLIENADMIIDLSQAIPYGKIQRVLEKIRCYHDLESHNFHQSSNITLLDVFVFWLEMSFQCILLKCEVIHAVSRCSDIEQWLSLDKASYLDQLTWIEDIGKSVISQYSVIVTGLVHSTAKQDTVEEIAIHWLQSEFCCILKGDWIELRQNACNDVNAVLDRWYIEYMELTKISFSDQPSIDYITDDNTVFTLFR